MYLLKAVYLALLEWQMYTLTLSSPLSPLSISALDLPTTGDVLLSSSPSSNTTNATLGDPPSNPYTIRLGDMPQSVVFTWEQYLRQNRVQNVLRQATSDIVAHPPTRPLFKGDKHTYSSADTVLTLPWRYQGDFTWGQWGNASECLTEYVRRFGPLGFTFMIFDHNLETWYYGGELLQRYYQNGSMSAAES